MKILICNAGSTSLKFKLYDMPAEEVLASGGVERVGSTDDAIYKYDNASRGVSLREEKQSVPDYETGIRRFLSDLTDVERGAIGSVADIDRVGFKTVLSRGYYGVHELTEPVLQGMRDMYAAAPAHNGPYLAAIEALRAVLPEAMFVGAFETDFHRTIPLDRCVYGVPYEWMEKYGVRRMGYHGASHSYVASLLNEWEGKKYRAISCHLGGSGSICAIENGESRDSSFGFTLQTGLIHNNRVGAMDADIIHYLRAQGLSDEEIEHGMTKDGGLKGISGVSGDLRYVLEAAEAGNERAKLAVDVYVTGIIRYIGAFAAELGGLDCLAFTGGIGENSAVIRKMVCERLEYMGVRLSARRNTKEKGDRSISKKRSKVRVYVIAANEELGVARKTYGCEKNA